jgi:hypothetical protein
MLKTKEVKNIVEKGLNINFLQLKLRSVFRNKLTIEQTSSESVEIWYCNKRLQYFRNIRQAVGTKKSVGTV